MAEVETIDQMNDQQLGQHAMKILARELGPAGFARFLRVYRSGSGDYTRDRDQWIGNLTMEDIRAKLEQIHR